MAGPALAGPRDQPGWSRTTTGPEAVFGVRLSEVFGWHRHHFDRLVHFAYGLCATMVPRLGAVRSLEVVAATSALYELFEWGVAVVLAPGMAEAYNGQQGDVRDAHKDMTMAPLGAVAAVLALGCRRGPGRVATEQAQGPRPTV